MSKIQDFGHSGSSGWLNHTLEGNIDTLIYLLNECKKYGLTHYSLLLNEKGEIDKGQPYFISAFKIETEEERIKNKIKKLELKLKKLESKEAKGKSKVIKRKKII